MTPDATHTSPTDLTRPPTAASVGDVPTVTGGAERVIQDLITHSTDGFATVPLPALDAPPGFVIERELGRGGMGVVYLARQAGLNRPCALKLVKSADQRALIRFLAEAEAVAAVRHPNVVEVFQYGDHHGKPYLALEYCPGGDLNDALRDIQLAPRSVAEVMAQIAEGVAAAHAAGIVHRDLKPHNVLLTADGTPKVTDFGLAKRGAGSDLTQTDAVMGTPAYMSPEQATGGAKFVGPPADVWALGVILYEFLAGRRPFAAGAPLEVVMQVVASDIPLLARVAPDVPADLALITHKCLARDPQERYPTAVELAADLRAWLAGEQISVRPPGAVERLVRWARRHPTVAAALPLAVLSAILCVVVLVVVISWRDAVAARGDAGRQREEAERQREQADQQRRQAVSAGQEAERAKETLAAFQYGGTMRVAHQELLDGRREATRLLLDGTDPKFRRWEWRYLDHLCRLTTTPPLIDRGFYGVRPHADERVVAVAFTPDSSHILSASRGGAAVLWHAGTGKTIITLDNNEHLFGAALSSDGTRVATSGLSVVERRPSGAFLASRYVKVWDASTGSLRLTLPATGMDAISFSQDGTRIAAADLRGPDTTPA